VIEDFFCLTVCIILPPNISDFFLSNRIRIRGMLTATHIANRKSSRQSRVRLFFRSLLDWCIVSIHLFFVRIGHCRCILPRHWIYFFVMCICWVLISQIFWIGLRSESEHEDPSMDLAGSVISSALNFFRISLYIMLRTVSFCRQDANAVIIGSIVASNGHCMCIEDKPVTE